MRIIVSDVVGLREVLCCESNERREKSKKLHCRQLASNMQYGGTVAFKMTR